MHTACEHFPFLEQMCRHEEFPTINPFFSRSHFPPFFWGRIFSFLFVFFFRCSRVKTSIYFTLGFPKENIIPVMTYLSPRIYPLSQEFHCHLRCCGASCSGPVLYHGHWLSGKENTVVYASPMQIPVRHPKTLLVSTQTWKEKKRTENLLIMVRRTSSFRQCYALIVMAMEKILLHCS